MSKMGKISIQLFTFEHPVNHSHSFLVASHKGGMTNSFGVYHIDPQRTTLTKLRQMIETRKDNGMVRRTLLFSEVLQTLSGTMNWHKYPRDIALFAYQFGHIVREKGVDKAVPRVIRIEDEDMAIGKLIPKGNPTRLPTVVVIPVSQICPIRKACHSDIYGEKPPAEYDEEAYYQLVRDKATSK
jgi:hypothetical protein